MIEEKTAMAAGQEAAEGAVTEATVAQKPKRHINQQKLQDNLWGWAFCLPLIVGTVLFIYIALVMALLLSFTTYSSALHGDVWEFLGRMFTGEADRFGLNVFQDYDPNGGANFCPYCGEKTGPEYAFCPNCGRKLPE